MRRAALIFTLFTLSVQAAALEVKVEGIPAYAQQRIAIPGQPRLIDVLSALQVPHSVYSPGTSLCRSALKERHQHIKQALLRDIVRMRERMGAFGEYSRRNLIIKLGQQIERLPVSGCKRMPLDFGVVTAHPIWNIALSDGDLLHYPPRPRTVVIAGAVDKEKTVPYAGNSVAHYTKLINQTAIADTDVVWVIQPDGVVESAPVAYWNREFHPVSPGAVIIVPVHAGIADHINPQFNRYLAELYAAQKVLP